MFYKSYRIEKTTYCRKMLLLSEKQAVSVVVNSNLSCTILVKANERGLAFGAKNQNDVIPIHSTEIACSFTFSFCFSSSVCVVRVFWAVALRVVV